MKKTALILCIALFAITMNFNCANVPSIEGLGSIGEVLQRKDAIIGTTKALRKGFKELTPKEEHYIGRAVAAKILGMYKPVKSRKLNNYINTVGQALARNSVRPETYGGYHFLLLNAPKEVNAFATPGGFIFITSGLYKKLKTEEQLAGVLAHEIAHVTERHGLSAIKSANLTKAFTILGTEAIKEYSSAEVAQLTEAFGGTVDDIVNDLVVNGYSRSQEYDADEEALYIAWRTGYNPAGLAEFLSTLKKDSAKAKSVGFFKTHPPAKDRLNEAKSILKKKKLIAKTSNLRTVRFGRYAKK